MAKETERLARGSPHPVIAAGSTGTVPATARLLKVIASLPNGAVVLPGLDKSLDEESWATLAEHPEHPQAGMAELLRKLGVRRDEVATVPGSEPDAASRARLHLASEALRPAESTEHWQQFLAAEELSPEGRASFANALAGMRLVVAPTAHDEAEAIALILRSASRRQARPRRWLRPTACWRGAWRRGSSATIWRSTILRACRSRAPCRAPSSISCSARSRQDFAPPELMALLKHPLALLGRRPERCARRGAGARARRLPRRLCRTRARRRASGAGRRTRTRKGAGALSAGEHQAALRLVADLEAAFAPLTELARGDLPNPAARLAEAHAAVAERLGARCKRLILGPMAGRCRRSALGPARRTDRCRTWPRAHRRRLSALLSQPRCRRGGAAAHGAASAPLHLGAARSAAAAARSRDPRQPQRRRVAAAPRGRPLAQPTDAREAWA